MTKKEAKAILACKRKIEAALDSCQAQLNGDNHLYMVHYWGANVRSLLSGGGYGSAPTLEAEEKLND